MSSLCRRCGANFPNHVRFCSPMVHALLVCDSYSRWRKEQQTSARTIGNTQQTVLRHLEYLFHASMFSTGIFKFICELFVDVQITDEDFQPHSRPHTTRFQVMGMNMCSRAYACYMGIDFLQFEAMLKQVEETSLNQRKDIENDLQPAPGFVPIRREPIIDRGL